MDLSLPLDLQQRIDAQLAAGGFASPEDVLREAIGALERRQRGLIAMRQMVAVADEDVAAGRTGSFDREAIKRQARDRLAEGDIQQWPCQAGSAKDTLHWMAPDFDSPLIELNEEVQ